MKIIYIVCEDQGSGARGEPIYAYSTEEKASEVATNLTKNVGRHHYYETLPLDEEPQ